MSKGWLAVVVILIAGFLSAPYVTSQAPTPVPSPPVVPAPLPTPPAPVPSPPPVPQPPLEVTGTVGYLITISSGMPASQSVFWYVDENLATDGQYYIDDNAKTIVLPSPKPGKFFVLAFAVIDGKLAKTKIIVTIQPNTATPLPTPVPQPTAGIADSLSVAFTKDKAAAPTASSDRAKLLALYSQAVFMTGNQRLKTVEDLNSALRSVAEVSLKPTDLANSREAIRNYIVANLPTDGSQMLTDELRKKFASVFTEISQTLKNLN